MASMSTFGSTLTDLQAGMNAAQGLEYQRSNFQNQIHAQQMADQLRARSEQQRTQAQRDAALAQIIESRNVRTQQGSQFDAEMQNRLALGQLEATSRKDVATIGARGMDPRFAQTLADIQAVNNEKQNDVAYKKKLSDQRKAAVAARDQIKANQKWFFPSSRGGSPNDPLFDVGQPDDPRWKQLNDMITQMDAQAITLGIAPAADGGYVVPDFTPMQMPAMLDPRYQFNLTPTNAPLPAFSPAPIPAPAAPPAFPIATHVLPEMIPTNSPPALRRWRLGPDGRLVSAP